MFVSLKTTKLLFTVQQLYFFREIEEKLFWVIEAINEASAINFIMKLSHTLYVIFDAKTLYSIPYSSGNTQIKRYQGPADPPLSVTSVSRGLMTYLVNYVFQTKGNI